MLKVLSYSCRFQNILARPSSITRPCSESNTPLSRVLNSVRGSNRLSPYSYRLAFFCCDCSDGGSDGSDSVADGGAAAIAAAALAGGGDFAKETSQNAIPPDVVWPDKCFQVLALPLTHRPLFPGFCMPVYVKDPKMLAALAENQRRQAPYAGLAGAFLVKDEPDSETDKNIYDLKGQKLLNRLHEVGTLAQITSIRGEQVILIADRRLRITEMVNEDPLTVKVNHLQDLPYEKYDDVIKATSFKVISTLWDVLQRSSPRRDHGQTYIKLVGEFNYPMLVDFEAAISGANKAQCQDVLGELDLVGEYNYPRLADFGAAISGANKAQCQEVLGEVDVLKRLQLTLELVKKDLEISKIQELGVETDDKTALTGKCC